MKTARQALKEHRATFWSAKNPDEWMATEAQLLAYANRQAGYSGRDHDDYAREVRGLTDKDQYYA